MGRGHSAGDRKSGGQRAPAGSRLPVTADSPRQSLTVTTAAGAPLTYTSRLLPDYPETASPKQDELKSLPHGLQGVYPQLAPDNLNSRLFSPEKGKLGAKVGVSQVSSRLESVFPEPQISNEVVSEIFPATPEIAEGERDGISGEPAYAEHCALPSWRGARRPPHPGPPAQEPTGGSSKRQGPDSLRGWSWNSTVAFHLEPEHMSNECVKTWN